MSKFGQLAMAAVGGAGLLWTAAPAIAQQQEIVVTGKMKIPEGFEPVERIVSIKGLDLATSAGAIEMDRRVRRTVENICATPRPVSKEEQSDSKLCSDFAWASARPQMDLALSKARRR